MSLHGHAATRSNDPRRILTCGNDTLFVSALTVPFRVQYFHLPEKAVAKELGICLTSLKKLCRSYGITRWPFRKLKSIQRTLAKVQDEQGGAAVAAGGGAAGGAGDTASGAASLAAAGLAVRARLLGRPCSDRAPQRTLAAPARLWRCCQAPTTPTKLGLLADRRKRLQIATAPRGAAGAAAVASATAAAVVSHQRPPLSQLRSRAGGAALRCGVCCDPPARTRDKL
jgi:hypothetical protein